MPTACITHPQARISLHSERLLVHGWQLEENQNAERSSTTSRLQPASQAQDRNHRSEATLLREIPIRDLDRLILHESVQLTAPALAVVLRRDIPISILGWEGHFLGGFLPAGNKHGAWRLLQYRRTLDPAHALEMAGRIVAAKVYNQRRVLQRMAANRELDLSPELTWMQSLLASAARSRTLDELRGFEGIASARYFQNWARFLPAAFPFERRSTRPPHNPVNACLSFAATLLYSETVAAIHSHGLDPALGLLHVSDDRRWSLALDLLEPFRPVLVEALTLDLFTHQMLQEKDFEPQKGGIYLSASGRNTLILQYERRMERQFLSEHTGNRTTLRQQIEQQAIDYKAALEAPDRFNPFLMN